MSLIEPLRAKIALNQFEFSQHAVDQSILRQISVQELREALANGEVIEDYPQDKYGPSWASRRSNARSMSNVATRLGRW